MVQARASGRRTLFASGYPAILVWLSVCAAAGGPAPGIDDGLAPIRQLLGSAPCTADAECHTIAVGVKPCGGPSAYLPWSSRQTEAPTLEAAVARYNKVQLARQQATGQASDCARVSDPGSVCVAIDASAGLGGRCELARGRGALVR